MILNPIVRFCLRFRGMILGLTLAALGYGLYALSQSKYDVYPEFAPPRVSIMTESPGLMPEQVEELVTRPIENALSGVEGIESVRSTSIQGLSIITLAFHPHSDIYQARQGVSERLVSLAGHLPAGISPVMTPLTSSTGLVLTVGLTSRKLSLMELRALADWTLKPALLAVPGVAKIAVYGGDTEQLQVQIHPELLVRYGLSLDDVIETARQATGVRGAGFIDTPNQRIFLQAEGQAIRPQDLAEVALVKGLASVRLKDVATVVPGPESPTGSAAILGEPGVILQISAQPGANTLELTRQLDETLTNLEPGLKKQGVALDRDLFRPARFVRTAVSNLRDSLLLGALCVGVVLFAFLFNFRTAAISCTAIPLSLLGAVTVLHHLGQSLNTMTLGGLAIAIGEVVDDAVIDVENILRRLRQNQDQSQPKPALEVIFQASLEVRSAVVYATLAVILVFIPVLTLSGVAGRLFSPLGVSYIFAVLASLVVALTVTPVLCAFLLPGRLQAEEPPLVHWLKRRYRSVLLAVERWPKAVLTLVALATFAGLAVLPFLGGEFLPELREGHFIVHVSSIPGTSIEESLRIGREISRALQTIPTIDRVSQRVGRAEKADDVWGTHYSEFDVALKAVSGEEQERAEESIHAVLGSFPGIQAAVKTYLPERMEEILSGYTASLVIYVLGDDLNVLDGKAREIAGTLRNIRGARDVQLPAPPEVPQFEIRLNRPALAEWGVTPGAVLNAVAAGFQGENVAQIYSGNRVMDVTVILPPSDRGNPLAVGSLRLRGASGSYVPLRDLAAIVPVSGRYSVIREQGRRAQAVTCNVEGRDIQSFVKEARERLAGLSLPAGYLVKFEGDSEAQAQSRNDLLVHSALVLIGALVLLRIILGSPQNLGLVLANLPFALAGGVFGVVLSGGRVSVGSMVGFVTLFGITLRNSIMLISHYEHLIEQEGRPWNAETALEGALDRLAPILMTALVTALGLLPLAVGHEAPGREIEGPMAIIILGGLATSTVLNLLVLPTLSLRWGRFKTKSDKSDHFL